MERNLRLPRTVRTYNMKSADLLDFYQFRLRYNYRTRSCKHPRERLGEISEKWGGGAYARGAPTSEYGKLAVDDQPPPTKRSFPTLNISGTIPYSIEHTPTSPGPPPANAPYFPEISLNAHSP